MNTGPVYAAIAAICARIAFCVAYNAYIPVVHSFLFEKKIR